jgi:protocatechuate 3,4-dioxygenase beta subunit
MRFLGVLLPAILFSAALPQTTRDNPASIEGIVVRAGTNTPIAGATVELTGIEARSVEGSSKASPGLISVSVLETESNGRVVSYLATTGQDGRFTIENIRPGENYQLVAINFPDFLPAQYGQRVPAVPGRPIALASNQQLKDVRIEMTPGGTISGRVVDQDGQPVRNVTVELRRPWYLEGWRLLIDWRQTIGRVQGVAKTSLGGMARTNGRGEFFFATLAPAQYYLRSSFSPESTATPINLHAGGNVTDIQLTVSEPRRHRIRGEVVDSRTGLPVRVAQINALRHDAVPLYQSTRAGTGAVRNGAFDITVPDSGSYILEVATIGNATASMRGRKVIDVDTDLRDLHIEIAPTFDMPGTLNIEGKAPVLNTRETGISLTLYPLSADAPMGRSINLPISGAFTVEDVTAGDFRVEILPILTVPPSALVSSSLQNAYVKSIRLGSKDVLNGGLHVEAATKDTLQVIISMNGGTVQGRVIDTNGKAVSNARAVLVPDAARRARGDLYKNASTDESGRFHLTGIAPGSYKLFAWERVEEGAWQDPQYIKLFEERGTSVQVRDNQQATIETKLIPAWN